ncbi:MAG TPA: replicative DNA helicase [Planctomycetota bacterium]|nr:replicative DNA helicase [Planctomycetota bacterium]
MDVGEKPGREKRRKDESLKTGLAADKLLEQVPPYDEAAEAGVLGAMLMDARAADVAIELLKVDDFYLPRHRVIFTVLCQLFQKTENVDELYLISELRKQGQLEAAGGEALIGRLILNTPSAANIESYCRVVRDRAVERELIEGAGKILNLVREPSGVDSEALVGEAESIVFKIAEKRSGEDFASMITLMESALGDAEKAHAARMNGEEIPCPAIPTHYADLDQLLAGGFWPGELIIVAGRPSMGKTTFALNIVRQISVGNENRIKPTAVFSLEMPREQIAKNILCAEAKLDGRKMRRYDFDDEEFERAQFYGKALQQAPIFVDDTSGISVSQLRSRCRRLKQREGVQLVVVDYLQLMKGSVAGKNSNREQEVAEISRGLKSIARELRIPIIVLSQLNRSAEKRENEDKKPQLSDLRESGSIEQDADVVIMLYRPEYWNIEENAKTRNRGEALVMKNRNGPVGSVNLTFFKDILRFESYVPDHNAAAGE